MDESSFRELYEKRGLSESEADAGVAAICDYERYLAHHGRTFEDSDVDIVKSYLESLLGSGHNSKERLIALARYSHLSGKSDVYIYFTSILGIDDIVENLSDRVALVAGDETKERVFANVRVPPAGSPPERIPPMTKEIVASLQRELSEADVHTTLTGNMHGIPTAAFEEERIAYEAAESVDHYLSDYHDRMVRTLEQHAKDGTPWFEQEITPEVVSFVRDNPEVLGGVREGHKIYLTKIPYDPVGWLRESDPLRKRYLACHCPLARASLQKDGDEVPPVWCDCSAGYAKLRFDVIYAQEVEAEVLQNVLEGSDRCRFAVTIPQSHR